MCADMIKGGVPRANRCPRVLTSSRVPVSSQLRRAAHQEPGGGPVQPKQKQSPFASRSVQRALLKRRRASTVRAIAAVKSALRAACQPRQEAGGGMPQKTADSGNTESASRWRPILASQCDLHSARIAAQWWAASSFFPPSVARGTTCRRPALVLHLRDARRRHDNQCSCEVSSLPFAY